MNLLVLIGSTRTGSHNARLAAAATSALPAGVQVEYADIFSLPFYSEEADAAGELGHAVERYRAAVARADAVLIVSPAYNGTMPGAVKNAVDTVSRPRGEAAIAGKPVAVISAPFNPLAGQNVVDHLTLALRIAGASPLERGLVVPFVDAFTETGLADPDLGRQLQELVTELVAPVPVG